MSHLIYLGLGTNLGDRFDNLRRARLALAPAVQVLICSPVYETPPWGVLDQPPYLNQAVKAQTDLAPESLLAHLKSLEAELGRTAGIRFGPRLIDLDLLFYDDLVFDTPPLSIPHPRLRGRGFILVPLNDLAPDLLHPVFQKTIAELLAECDPAGIQVLPQAGSCP